MAGVYVDDFGHVGGGLDPPVFVAPGFLDGAHKMLSSPWLDALLTVSPAGCSLAARAAASKNKLGSLGGSGELAFGSTCPPYKVGDTRSALSSLACAFFN